MFWPCKGGLRCKEEEEEEACQCCCEDSQSTAEQCLGENREATHQSLGFVVLSWESCSRLVVEESVDGSLSSLNTALQPRTALHTITVLLRVTLTAVNTASIFPNTWNFGVNITFNISLHLQVTPSTAMLCDPPASFCTRMPKCYADEIISR
ncbi:hypothetical protein E2C01_018609 [Portunus trituberculatus]|uniref:Uncharacterized protein n=1 Tax=Portunus trituberculatus TaxID=210409 RepID=A0A5B7DUY8_PORTR|nr:hypothetical protein [Portunus trituberculatus]